MIYDFIIIGAGAAGLFAGASLHRPIKGLMLNKGKTPGQKILMSGGGKCNATHGGSIKDFISNYGKNGNRIRTVLYQFNNQEVIKFFEEDGIAMTQREDGKVFPSSFCAEDVRDALLKACYRNGFELKNQVFVTGISYDKETKIYTVYCEGASYQSLKLLVSTGGCSYPGTGSDGQFFSRLEDMGIAIERPKPALVPIYVDDYPYKELSGISFSHAIVSIHMERKIAEESGDVLFAHHCFSGPAILDISEHAQKGSELRINYFPWKNADLLVHELSSLIQGNAKTFISVLYSYLNSDSSTFLQPMPKRFLENICLRCGVASSEKASRVAVKCLKDIIKLLTADSYKVSRLGDYRLAMVTAGGVSLDEIHTKSLESKKYPGLYFAGEVLDIAGKTGGYNLQFAFSSGHLVASEVEKTLSD